MGGLRWNQMRTWRCKDGWNLNIIKFYINIRLFDYFGNRCLRDAIKSSKWILWTRRNVDFISGSPPVKILVGAFWILCIDSLPFFKDFELRMCVLTVIGLRVAFALPPMRFICTSCFPRLGKPSDGVVMALLPVIMLLGPRPSVM